MELIDGTPITCGIVQPVSDADNLPPGLTKQQPESEHMKYQKKSPDFHTFPISNFRKVGLLGIWEILVSLGLERPMQKKQEGQKLEASLDCMKGSHLKIQNKQMNKQTK